MGTEQATVLVIDDEESVRFVASLALRDAGFEVLVAADGVEALEVYRRDGERIAVVLLDLKMPRMNGDQVLAELRRIRADVRVILSSGSGESTVLSQFAGWGVAGYLPKPYDPTRLLQIVRNVLGTA